MRKYSIGIDYGTLSARAVLVDLSDGKEVAARELKYPHAVIPEDYFEGIVLEKTTALQHPRDYLDALEYTVKGVISDAGVDPADIVGLGIDFTCSTVLPVTKDGTPLCFLDEFKSEPHAYVKLWKHHSAQREADLITEEAIRRGEPWLDIYGGKVSSEWMMPKLLEIKRKAPRVYDKTAFFLEAADWIVWQITGVKTHSSCIAGYKGLWRADKGYPSNDFWAAVGLDNIIGTKISETVIPAGSYAGGISPSGRALTGLCEGTAVASPISDAAAALPAAGVVEPGTMVMIIGTSACHFALDERERPIKGLCGIVKDAIVKGLFAYEAGQSGAGDNFDWFIKSCITEKYAIEARERGVSVFDLMTEKASALRIGEGGILALDWFSGNRSPYADYDLTGMLIGLNLNTKPEEIYRAILEATVFGTKRIAELYENGGIKIDGIVASGGIARKNPLLMQMYADVLGREIRIARAVQAGAKGSAVLASVAGGHFATLREAADVISDGCDITYIPDPENTAKYQRLYNEYKALSEYFAKESPVMKRLGEIRNV